MTSSVGFIAWLTQLQKSKGKYEKPVVEQETSIHYSFEAIKNNVWLDFVYLNMVVKQNTETPGSNDIKSAKFITKLNIGFKVPYDHVNFTWI